MVPGIGSRVRKAREAAHMTQQELADAVFVTQQSVAGWENEDSLTDPDKILAVSRILNVSPTYLVEGDRMPRWMVNDEIFNPDRMYTRLMTIATSDRLRETARALPYAWKKHEGMKRRTSRYATEEVPYIMHPLLMACHAHAMGIKDDTVLAVCLLHDVCEDCGVAPEELPFSKDVQDAVALLTKKKLPKDATKEEKKARDDAYYAGIRTSPTASIVKALDRCNNVALMSLSFPKKKLAEYIIETETYVYPLLDHLRYHAVDYSDQVFLIKYQLRSTIETIKALLNRDGEL